MLVPLLLLGVRQGGELLTGLFDDSGFAVGVRAGAMVFIYYAQALAIWLVPRPVFHRHPWTDFQPLRALTGQNSYVGLFVSALPIMLYGVVMLVVQSRRSFVWWQLILTLATMVATLYAAYQVARPHPRLVRKPTLFWLQIFVVADAIGLCLIMLVSKKLVFWNYYFVGLSLCILVVLLAGVFHRLEAQARAGNFLHYNRFYWALLITTLTGLLFLSLVNSIQLISPTFMLLTITTVYIVLSGLVVALFVLKKRQSFQFLLTVLLLLLGWLVFVQKSRIHDVNYVNDNGFTSPNRPALSSFFKSWYESNLSQLFPVMNSSTYIAGCGNFFDGGLFENMGLPLMTNLYKRLPDEIKNAPYLSESMRKRLRLQLLFLVNAAVEPRDSSTAFRRKNQMGATFSALTSSGIGGRTTWWFEYCRQTYPDEGQPNVFVLQLPTDKSDTKLPLGRWLSAASIARVKEKMEYGDISDRLDTLAQSVKQQ